MQHWYIWTAKANYKYNDKLQWSSAISDPTMQPPWTPYWTARFKFSKKINIKLKTHNLQSFANIYSLPLNKHSEFNAETKIFFGWPNNQMSSKARWSQMTQQTKIKISLINCFTIKWTQKCPTSDTEKFTHLWILTTGKANLPSVDSLLTTKSITQFFDDYDTKHGWPLIISNSFVDQIKKFKQPSIDLIDSYTDFSSLITKI